jgi:hypothetical protein
MRQCRKLTLYHGLEVGSHVLSLLLGVLQLFLQVGRLLLRLACLDVLDVLDFLRGLDLGLQPCFMGCGGL